MSKVTFRELPILVKAAVFVSFSTAWVMFEELVIDRYGLWRFLPFYEFGRFCAWDVSALVVIGSGLAWAALSPRSDRAACRVAPDAGPPDRRNIGRRRPTVAPRN